MRCATAAVTCGSCSLPSPGSAPSVRRKEDNTRKHELARHRRREKDFTVAVRAIALCLVECAEAPAADFLLTRTMTLQSLWRVAAAAINQLPDMDFDHRATIGIMQDGLDSMLPQLTSYALIATTTNPGLFDQAKDIARNAGLMVIPVTELFDRD